MTASNARRWLTMLAGQIRRRGVKEQPGAMERLVTMLAGQIHRPGVKEQPGETGEIGNNVGWADP